jgi:hypothetical protein
MQSEPERRARGARPSLGARALTAAKSHTADLRVRHALAPQFDGLGCQVGVHGPQRLRVERRSIPTGDDRLDDRGVERTGPMPVGTASNQVLQRYRLAR